MPTINPVSYYHYSTKMLLLGSGKMLKNLILNIVGTCIFNSKFGALLKFANYIAVG